MAAYGVECPNCEAVSENVYRCGECGKDLIDETGDSQGGERHV